jgi:branched-chain amino acid transport system substrate-binding protein
MTLGIDRRRVLQTSTGAAFAAVAARGARAQTTGRQTLKLGIIQDMSGPYAYEASSALICCKQAIQDFGATNRGIDVEVLIADHQNKPDIAAGIAREWFDRGGVDCLVDVSTSATALPASQIAREKNKVLLVVGAGSTALTGAQCSPNTIHWSWDTYMLAHASGTAMVKQGGDSWFFLAADYTFGHQLVSDTTDVVTASGGKVLGSVYTPFPGTTDFSAFLVQAQASGAKVLGLCNSGADTFNCLKQANEFGLNKTMRILPLLMYATDLKMIGLDITQGTMLTESFYWDLNARTRSFMDRIRPKSPNDYPNMSAAGIYSDTLHYLKVAADMGVAQAKADGAATVVRMKAMPTDDDVYGPGSIREDGRKLHPAYLFKAKTPAESKQPWDVMTAVETIPADQAFRPLDQGKCSFVHT